MPLIVGVGLSQVLLQFPHRYFESPGFLLDKEVFGELVGISIEGSPCSLFPLTLLSQTFCSSSY